MTWHQSGNKQTASGITGIRYEVYPSHTGAGFWMLGIAWTVGRDRMSFVSTSIVSVAEAKDQAEAWERSRVRPGMAATWRRSA